MNRFCVAFADGQGVAFEVCEPAGNGGDDVLTAWFGLMRKAIHHAFELARGAAIVRFGKLKELAKRPDPKAIHDELGEMHPIRIEAGFEGNPGVQGGVWRPRDGGDDGLVHLRFAAGTEDLPLHVHEFSDRLLVVTSGVGLFHYIPEAGGLRELRSVVVEAGDSVLFRRNVVHTFTAPLNELTLLSYHAPFFAFDDIRQFTVPTTLSEGRYVWIPGRLAGGSSLHDAAAVALSA